MSYVLIILKLTTAMMLTRHLILGEEGGLKLFLL